ncbi:hypothetical protein Tco_0580591 [Tanacetum coccineum]
MLHGLVINWSSSAIETSRNRVNVFSLITVSIVMIRRMLGRVARETLGIACGVDEEEEVSDDEDEIRVQVLMALADDELSVGKNHGHNGEWIYITIKKVNILLSMDEDSDWQNYLKYINIDLKDDLLVLKQAQLEAVTFQIQNTKLTKLNHALQDQLKEERKLTESSSKNDAKDNPFVPTSLDDDNEMVPKSKD